MLACAATRHAILDLGDLERAGWCAAAVWRQCATGQLFRVHRGVYAVVPPELLTREGRYLAAVLAAGAGAALSHRSAAQLLEIRGTQRSRIEVTVTGHTAPTLSGVDAHRSRTLDPARDVTTVRGIPVTTIARTLIDLCEVLPKRAVERAMNEAEVRERLDLAAIRDQLARNQGRHRAHVLATLIDTYHGPDTLTASALEERMLAIIRAAGLPAPEVNGLIPLPDGEPIYGDFLWRAQRLIVETDGRSSHGTAQAFESDRVRDQRAMLAGWRVVRFTRRQVFHDAPRVTATIAALLGNAGLPSSFSS